MTSKLEFRLVPASGTLKCRGGYRAEFKEDGMQLRKTKYRTNEKRNPSLCQGNHISPLASAVEIWYSGRIESFSRADVVLRVSSSRGAWLAKGSEEGFCNYFSVLKSSRKERQE